MKLNLLEGNDAWHMSDGAMRIMFDHARRTNVAESMAWLEDTFFHIEGLVKVLREIENREYLAAWNAGDLSKFRPRLR